MTPFKRREGHDLGRRLPRARGGALAGRHQAGHGDQRDHLARGLGADVRRRRRRAGRQGEAADGLPAAGKTFKVHLDGYDQHDLLAGTGPGKRQEYFYWTDDGNLAGLRYERWKIVLMEQRGRGPGRLAEPADPAALSQALRRQGRPVRVGAGGRRRLRQVARRAGLRAGPCPGVRRQAPGDLPAIPAVPEARQLLARCRAGEATKHRRIGLIDQHCGSDTSISSKER